MYKCKYFKIQELVPKHVFDERGEKAWELLDETALITLDRLRGKYGPITVNNWHIGGDRQWSGFRTNKSDIGAAYSQHRYGRAFDCLFANTSADKVRADLFANPGDSTFEYINAVETDISWFHFDVRNTSRVAKFKPV